MPYIEPSRRVGLREPVDKIVEHDQAGNPSWMGTAISRIATWSNYIPSVCPEVDEIIKVISERKEKGDNVAGDINFCISRLLVKVTKIHEEARYFKIHWINEMIKVAGLNISHWCGRGGVSALTVLDDVKMELYRRYAAPYEDKKRKPVSEGGNGDITD